jgi:F420-0:gamma-glutamyl ligase
MSKFLALLTPIALGAAALEIAGMKVGDCRVSLRSDKITEKTIFFADDNRACLRFNVPFKNTGRQQGLLIDTACFLQPVGDAHSDLQPVVRWINRESPRADGYWEACIVKPGSGLLTTVEIWLSAKNIREKLKGLSIFRVDCHYKFYCRTPMHYRKEELTFTLDSFEEIQRLPEIKKPEEEPKVASKKKASRNPLVLPLRTQLLRPGDDLIEVVKQATQGVGQPGDLVAIAETVVAIVQGRLVYCEDIKPSYFATRLNKLFEMNSSLSSPYALEMAIREVGLPKILMSVVAGAVGKVRGKPGEFYRVAGRSVATIDDCTGTLPPFDKHVVMGPARGDQLCASIKAATGYEIAIVDANDLGKVDVLHLSDPTRHDAVVEALKPNPQGNADEMTPVVLIKKEFGVETKPSQNGSSETKAKAPSKETTT